MDSKKVTSALGYLDLKQICYCLAQALNKHIQFSQGMFFLGDLQDYVKQQQQIEKMENIRDGELEFTYNLGSDFKIDIEAAKKRVQENKEEKQEESKKQFEDLKKKMEESGNATPMSNMTEKLKAKGLQQEDSKEEPIEDIEDEVADKYSDDEFNEIEDYYGTMDSENKAKKEAKAEANNEDDMDLDLDYSQTHLDDFLKSQTNSTMKGTNVQSGQLLTSFLSTYKQARSGSGTGLTGSAMDQSNAMVAKAKDPAMNPIQEREGDEQSYTSEKKGKDSDSDEDLGRTNEVIELENVSVKSKPSSK